MTWAEMTENWSTLLERLATRFPHLDTGMLETPPPHHNALAAHLAECHDLTLLEAKEELMDWLYVQDLARQAMELTAA